MYTALYRKLRPGSFDEIVAQGHIVNTLRNQIAGGRIGHAYLFCGTRGTGKTSCAKVFARAANCLASIEGEACGICASCTEIAAGNSMDVVEIDAASNNGVDNVRDLREDVKYPPTTGRHRIFIVDEVHMMTTAAFNALLKTLEEPPPHVIFILATTDPQRIPPTILSRVMRFDFRRISPQDMAVALRGYMEKENIDISGEALGYISELSDGAMRDALSLIDRCAGLYFGELITLERVLEITGTVDKSVFFELAKGIFAGDIGLCIGIVEKIIANGRDVVQFVSEFVHELRNLMIFAMPGGREGLFVSESARLAMERLVNITNIESIISKINIFSDLRARLRHGGNDRIQLEVALVQACNPMAAAAAGGDSAALAGIMDRLNRLETRPQPTFAPPTPAAAPVAPEPAPIQKAIPEDIRQIINKWDEFCRGLDASDSGLLGHTKPGFLDDGRLIIVVNQPAHEGILKKRVEGIEAALQKHFGKAVDIHIMLKIHYDDRHRKKYGGLDDFKPGTVASPAVSEKIVDEFDEIKKVLNFNIIEE